MKEAWKELHQNNNNGSLSVVIGDNYFFFHRLAYFLDCDYITFIIKQ